MTSPAAQTKDIGEAWRDTACTYEKKSEQATRKRKDTIVLSGFGVSLRIEKGTLIIRDGLREAETLPVTYTLEPYQDAVNTIICISTTGNYSVEALSFCDRHDIVLYRFNPDTGMLVAVSNPDRSTDIARRKLQYSVALDEKKLQKMALFFVREKCNAYIRCFDALVKRDAAKSDRCSGTLENAREWLKLESSRWNNLTYLRAFEADFGCLNLRTQRGHALIVEDQGSINGGKGFHPKATLTSMECSRQRQGFQPGQRA